MNRGMAEMSHSKRFPSTGYLGNAPPGRLQVYGFLDQQCQQRWPKTSVREGRCSGGTSLNRQKLCCTLDDSLWSLPQRVMTRCGNWMTRCGHWMTRCGNWMTRGGN